MKMLVSAWPVTSLFLSLSLPLMMTGCGGSDDSSGDDGVGIPASIIADADLLPGVLAAYDADDVKKEIQFDFREFLANPPETTGTDCEAKLYETITLKTSGTEYRAEADLDFSTCTKERYASDTTYQGADFSEFSAKATLKLIVYGNCAGVNLDEFNGKPLRTLTNSNPCNTGTGIKATTESIFITSQSGKITNIATVGSEEKLTEIFDYESTTHTIKRGTKGRTCSLMINAGIKSYDDNCEEITRTITTKDASGFEGNVNENDDINKAHYLKKMYSGVTGQADTTSSWYTGGMFEVTLNDWTGTVRYSSPTAEPIYEFNKGSETVTGTIKETVE